MGYSFGCLGHTPDWSLMELQRYVVVFLALLQPIELILNNIWGCMMLFLVYKSEKLQVTVNKIEDL